MAELILRFNRGVGNVFSYQNDIAIKRGRRQQWRYLVALIMAEVDLTIIQVYTGSNTQDLICYSGGNSFLEHSKASVPLIMLH